MVEGFFWQRFAPQSLETFCSQLGPNWGPCGSDAAPGPPKLQPSLHLGAPGRPKCNPSLQCGAPGPGQRPRSGRKRTAPHTHHREAGKSCGAFPGSPRARPGTPATANSCGAFSGPPGGVLEALGGGPGGPGRGPGGPDNAPHDFAVGVPTQRAHCKVMWCVFGASRQGPGGPGGAVLQAPGRGPGGPGRRSWRPLGDWGLGSGDWGPGTGPGD